MILFSEFQLGSIQLKNRVVMAPMTRSRAMDNIPNDLMATYYAQRADAGLLITEGVAPSANGLGYARIPGVYSKAQVEGWKQVTNAVHDKGGKIFMQIMHTGRVSHPANMEEGSEVVAPSAIAASGEMYSDTKGMQPHPIPKAMTKADIEQAQQEFVNAAKNAIEAGFDGIELHGANGYLIDQFINPQSNKRDDEYGGNIENRSRFAIETAQKVAAAIGANKTAIRLSPNGAFNDLLPFDEVPEQFTYLAKELGKLKLVYLHIVDHSAMGAPEVAVSIKRTMKEVFGGSMVISGGFDKEKAEKGLQEDFGELAAFGRPFISNPDLVHKLKNDIALTEPDFDTFYTPGEKGYTDYPRT